jgi:hypothetical protein
VAGALRLAAVVALLAAPAMAGETVRTLEGTYSAAGVETVSLEVPVGEVRIVGAAGEIAVEIELRCKPRKRDCAQAAGRVRLETRRRGGRLEIAVEGWPDKRDCSLELEMEMRMPPTLALAAELGVGEIDVEGLARDVSVDLGVGEAELRLPASAVREVELEVGVGDASLEVDGRTLDGSGFMGRSLVWKGGHGRARVAVDCGVGEARVVLR